eukprot:TRINITY_DN5328_c0_g1_i1.p1 TRINITY_DN5328_c0_g1~~TRINITY_DN5328_c0_g1_i1.p1  ORF type:complete len:175 (+),score=51.61 TRINITY_DN5328_c0_g1_i1:28-525(+)
MGKLKKTKKTGFRGRLRTEHDSSLMQLTEDSAPVLGSRLARESQASSVVNLKEKTRGAILQRHKKEWKGVRKQIEELKEKRARTRASSLIGKADKKALTKSITALKGRMTTRHKAELSFFDEKEKSKAAQTMEVTDGASVPDPSDISGAEASSVVAVTPTDAMET